MCTASKIENTQRYYTYSGTHVEILLNDRKAYSLECDRILPIGIVKERAHTTEIYIENARTNKTVT